MKNSDDKKNQPKKELRCDPKQLDLLRKCSDKRDISEWNKWREENPEEEIWLEGADLEEAHIEGADLGLAHLKGASFGLAHLEGANLQEACLQEAVLLWAHLERTYLLDSHLERANLYDAHLEGADLTISHLEGADFTASIVDGLTLFWECSVDRKTDFRGVGLESCRIDERTKYLLQYNKRRMNCEDWYEQHPRLAWLAKAFFWMSDYGRSTSRIIFTFFGLALIFANIYYHWARLAPPGIVSNLLIDENGLAIPWWLVPLRTLYFSIVTMTTLGFGDMYAQGQSIFGHLLLMLQVLLGYVLLGALVTRFGILFTSGLISGEFKSREDRGQKTKDRKSDF